MDVRRSTLDSGTLRNIVDENFARQDRGMSPAVAALWTAENAAFLCTVTPMLEVDGSFRQ
jgi:hypothetical protein